MKYLIKMNGKVIMLGPLFQVLLKWQENGDINKQAGR